AIEEVATPAVEPKQPWPSERPVLQEMVSEIEESLGDGFLTEKEPVAEAEPEPASAQAVAPTFRAGTLDEFVSDLEASLGNDLPVAPSTEPVTPARQVQHPVAPVYVAQPAASAPAHHPVAFAAAASTGSIPVSAQPIAPPVSKVDAVAAVDLSDMFGDLKQELEDNSAQSEEDPETHYNLGVAFREMGLLDEAIGEFQKVC